MPARDSDWPDQESGDVERFRGPLSHAEASPATPSAAPRGEPVRHAFPRPRLSSADSPGALRVCSSPAGPPRAENLLRGAAMDAQP